MGRHIRLQYGDCNMKGNPRADIPLKEALKRYPTQRKKVEIYIKNKTHSLTSNDDSMAQHTILHAILPHPGMQQQLATLLTLTAIPKSYRTISPRQQ